MAKLSNAVQAINGLTDLFWEMTPPTLSALQANQDFRYIWDTYLKNKKGEKAFYELWRCWMLKFSTPTKQVLLDYIAGNPVMAPKLDLAVSDELVALESLTLLFWDYTSEDIAALRHHENFDECWKAYVQPKSGEATFQALWRCWKKRFTSGTKQILIDYAVSRFGQEKREGLSFDLNLRRQMAMR